MCSILQGRRGFEASQLALAHVLLGAAEGKDLVQGVREAFEFLLRIVTEEVARFVAWLRSRGAIPTVVALRQKFEAIRRAELERLDFKLSALPPDARREARAVVDEITRLIIEKLLLTPTAQLKEVGDHDTLAVYSEALTRLFGLTPSADAEPEPGPPGAERPERGEGRVEAFRAKSRPSNRG